MLLILNRLELISFLAYGHCWPFFVFLFKSPYRILDLRFQTIKGTLLLPSWINHIYSQQPNVAELLSALLDNASEKVMQDDSSVLSELHMGLSFIR
jgi:hypothetical protein